MAKVGTQKMYDDAEKEEKEFMDRVAIAALPHLLKDRETPYNKLYEVAAYHAYLVAQEMVKARKNWKSEAHFRAAVLAKRAKDETAALVARVKREAEEDART